MLLVNPGTDAALASTLPIERHQIKRIESATNSHSSLTIGCAELALVMHTDLDMMHGNDSAELMGEPDETAGGMLKQPGDAMQTHIF